MYVFQIIYYQSTFNNFSLKKFEIKVKFRFSLSHMIIDQFDYNFSVELILLLFYWNNDS